MNAQNAEIAEQPTQQQQPQTKMYRIAGEKVASSASAEDAEDFREEVDYLHYFVVRIGEDLGMNMVDYAAFVECDSRVGFRFNKNHGVQTSEINGMTTTAPIPITQLLDELS